MRVARQVLEVGEVSQRGGQGGDALVGEVVISCAEYVPQTPLRPVHEPSLNTNIGGLVPSIFVQYIYYRHLSLYGTQCTYGESHREGCVRATAYWVWVYLTVAVCVHDIRPALTPPCTPHSACMHTG